MTEENKGTQSNQISSTFVLKRSLITGFFGGIIWSILGVVMYYFNFSEVAPKTFLLRSWSTSKWTNEWLGEVVSIVMIGVLSILVAFIYYVLLKKVNTVWSGVGYGIILWGIVFYVLQPMFPTIPHLAEFNRDTIITTLCLFILYGTFVGYSISFDYHNMLIKTMKNKNEDPS